MAGAGPQRYPGASTAYFYQSRYGGDLMEVNVVVLHTTEGRTLPDYGGGGSAPNLTAVPDFAAKRLKWYQHFDIDRSSRALVNLSGGVETNTNNVCQVELVGTCDPATRTAWIKAGKRQDADFIYWPEAPDWALRDVADFLAWANKNHGVPLSGPKTWKAYPASYGKSNGVRMTGAEWNAFKGVCGHQHVTENDHGDPGAIDFARLLQIAKGDTSTPTPSPSTTTGTDMKLTDAVTLGTWVTKQWPDDKGLADLKVSVNTALGGGYTHARRGAENTDEIIRQLEALRTEVAQLRAAVTKGA